nr:MAG TPA: hypothetical protein [Bacteriophage sp.]
MFNKKLKLKEDNKYLKIENNTLKEEIDELKKELKKYRDGRDNTLEELLKDFNYAILVGDKYQTKLFNDGKWETKVKGIEFSCENHVFVPEIKITK